MAISSPSTTTGNSADILESEIEFIDSDEFNELDYSEADLELVRELSSTMETNAARHPNSPLGGLLQNSLPPLTADEERILFRRMNYLRFQAEAIRSTLTSDRTSKTQQSHIRSLLHEADQVVRRIVESNLRLVVSVAKKYSSSSQEFQDLVSDGLMILIGAIQKFDYSRGYRFSTYATHSVQRHYFRVIKRQQTHTRRFVLTGGEVMAEVAGTSDPEPVVEEDPSQIYERLMSAAKDCLSEREETILNRRFGTGGLGVTQTLREVAADLGLSKERVRQIQISALAKLKEVALDSSISLSAS